MTRFRVIDIAAILVAVFAVHLQLLLDTGVYFDDWLVYTYVAKKDWHLLTAMVRERGIVPVEAYFWWMFRDLPPLGYKVAAFVMIVWLAVMAVLLLRTGALLSRQDSLLVGLFMICYSGYQSWVLFCTAHYAFFYCLFLTGAWLGLRAEQHSGVQHWWRRVAALTLFAASYGLNSLLVLTLLFAALLVLHLTRLHHVPLVRGLAVYLPRRSDYVALPVLYWVAVKWLLPVQGLLTGYNEIVTAPAAVAQAMTTFAQNSVYSQARKAVVHLADHPLLVVVAVLAAAAIWLASRRTDEIRPVGRLWTLALAVIWVGVAMLPYALVEKPASDAGWGTRHALLVSFPLGVLVVGVARLLGTGGGIRAPLAGVAVVSVLCVGMAATMNEVYVELQARAIKDEAVMAQLGADPLARKTSVFWVDDTLPQVFSESYRYFEWAGMFERTFGDQKRIGFDRQVYWKPEVLISDRPYFISKYRLGELDPSGCQAVLRIEWGALESAGLQRPPELTDLVRRYQRLRFFAGEKAVSDYLRTVVQTRLTPLAAAEATHCTTGT